MSNLRGSEWLILILLVVLLFGARRLPDAARGIGRSLRIFKAETKGLGDPAPDDPAEAKPVEAVTPPPPAVHETPVSEPNKPTQT
jgi:sec-independent protein translocase protein TatA